MIFTSAQVVMRTSVMTEGGADKGAWHWWRSDFWVWQRWQWQRQQWRQWQLVDKINNNEGSSGGRVSVPILFIYLFCRVIRYRVPTPSKSWSVAVFIIEETVSMILFWWVLNGHYLCLTPNIYCGVQGQSQGIEEIDYFEEKIQNWVELRFIPILFHSVFL